LSGVDLRGATMVDVNLGGANLRGAVLIGADLRRAHMRGCDMRGADLREANLAEADLAEANLANANLIDANLGAVDMTLQPDGCGLDRHERSRPKLLRAKSLTGAIAGRHSPRLKSRQSDRPGQSRSFYFWNCSSMSHNYPPTPPLKVKYLKCHIWVLLALVLFLPGRSPKRGKCAGELLRQALNSLVQFYCRHKMSLLK
jgi:hypothetical protein